MKIKDEYVTIIAKMDRIMLNRIHKKISKFIEFYVKFDDSLAEQTQEVKSKKIALEKLHDEFKEFCNGYPIWMNNMTEEHKQFFLFISLLYKNGYNKKELVDSYVESSVSEKIDSYYVEQLLENDDVVFKAEKWSDCMKIYH